MSLPVSFSSVGDQLGALDRRTERQLSKQLATVQTGSAVAVAKIEAAVQRRSTVTQGVTALAGQAMQQVAMIGQAEQQLAQAVPAASGRLAAVADTHALVVTNILWNAATALERLA